MSEARRVERELSRNKTDFGVGNNTPFMPFDLARFIMFLSDAVSVAEGPQFLDVGCGPGIKAMVAAKLFGLFPAGIDIIPRYVEMARSLGVQAMTIDARYFRGYGSFDIVYVNRPVRGEQQAMVELDIAKAMKVGAVLMSVNGMVRMSDYGWETVAEEWDAMDGVWRKVRA